MSGDPIWVVDEVETRPGQGQTFLDAYMTYYAPGAAARGMTLAHRMVEPAMWLDDAPNRILLIWTVPHVGLVWGAKHVARGDMDVLRWWNEEAPKFILSRRRSTMAAADALAGLAGLANV
ncbi:hypothetical protein ACFB49_24550 [Sphingomonas sp. DBB INV C78]|uniref:hypothetical protein n=1 Tax=Sphingomonas sp. DBB INV C78 TaxID=3349434 RepID=UPI0036D31F32